MTLDTGFQTDQPAVGPAIFENQTDDLKVTWSLTWIFTLAEALSSSGCAARTISTGAWFRMNINLGGSGLQLQELHFTQMPVQTSIDGGVVTWTGTVIANHLYNADDEFDDIIVELPPPWDSWLDIVVTGYPDGRDPESYRGCRNAELQEYKQQPRRAVCTTPSRSTIHPLAMSAWSISSSSRRRLAARRTRQRALKSKRASRAARR
jgi:hypothetical protein